MASLAEQRGFGVIDCFSLFADVVERTGKAYSLPGDPCHPNRMGATLIARTVADALAD